MFTAADFLPNFQSGFVSASNNAWIRKKLLIQYLRKFRGNLTLTTSFRHVAAIEWHPYDPKRVAILSGDGCVILWNTGDEGSTGLGAVAGISICKFDPWESGINIFMVSVDGDVLKRDYTYNITSTLRTHDFQKSYVSLGVNGGLRTMAVGDKKGNLTVLTNEGVKVGEYRINKGGSPVSQVEFCERKPHILATSSDDHLYNSVKLWDIRMFGEKACKPLMRLEHTAPVNGAVFSKTDGCRLLTTDQRAHIRIYLAPMFRLERTIFHPRGSTMFNRRAEWHPQEDIIVAGRNSSWREPELKTINFYDAATGELMHELYGHPAPKIINKFNCTGEALISSIRSDVMLWKPDLKEEEV